MPQKFCTSGSSYVILSDRAYKEMMIWAFLKILRETLLRPLMS